MNTQFKKGVLELLVFSLLVERDHYGYEMVEAISDFINISEGSIYPLLRRLSKEGYVDSYLKESESGPPRKYYRLSQAGRDNYQAQKEEWKTFVKNVNQMLGDEDE